MAESSDVVTGVVKDCAGVVLSCSLCGGGKDLLRCSRCRSAYYCSKEHQTQHWKVHRKTCGKENKDTNNTSEGQTERDARTKCVNIVKENSKNGDGNDQRAVGAPPAASNNKGQQTVVQPVQNGKSTKAYEGHNMPSDQVSSLSLLRLKVKMHSKHADKIIHNTTLQQRMCNQIISDMNTYGICVIDKFLGDELGTEILKEVRSMYDSGVFVNGQLVSNRAKETATTIRGDKITWIGGTEEKCGHIGDLMNLVDSLVFQCNKHPNNGVLGKYDINGRSKAMVACYPGGGAHYVKHVDNPNNDGRCITSIYYLNKDWTVTQGGLLRIFPEGTKHVADIQPLFDRILFFWSDRRNPHEVQASYETRYAITLWYFDRHERENAMQRYQSSQKKRTSD